MAINNVVMTGRLTADVELKQTPNGVYVCHFTIAQNKNKDASPEFFDCVAWRQTAELVSRYFQRGDGIEVVGRLSARTYEKDGYRRKAVEIVCDNVSFPMGKVNREAAPTTTTAPSYSPPPANYEEVYSDDDLPF